MSRPGSYRVPSRNRAFENYLDPGVQRARRVQRILDSLRSELGGEGTEVRIRRIFSQPREIFRLEIEAQEMGYQRTTLLDRDALDELMESDDVRARIRIQGE